jgi:hypothetical protein
MLRVRRATVSLTAGVLHNAGLISYACGVITRGGLADVACYCYCYRYCIIRDELDQLRSV